MTRSYLRLPSNIYSIGTQKKQPFKILLQQPTGKFEEGIMCRVVRRGSIGIESAHSSS